MKVDSEALSSRMASRGMRQQDLAVTAGCSISTVSNINRGLPCKYETVKALARALGCDVLDIIVDEEVK